VINIFQYVICNSENIILFFQIKFSFYENNNKIKFLFFYVNIIDIFLTWLIIICIILFNMRNNILLYFKNQLTYIIYH